MGFRELAIKHAYDSDRDDILQEFYIPVLSEAVRYRRLAGFFSSTSLAVAARGITNFLRNNGTMDLIVGARLSKRDVDAISRGITKPEQVLAENFVKSLDEVSDQFERDHVRALAWLVAKGRMNIRVAIPLDSSGRPLDVEAAQLGELFHQKVGILFDSDNNVISFSGSINESALGWTRHIEEFKAFCSWLEGQRTYLQADIDKVENFWEGRSKRTLVMNVPDAVRDRLVKMAPKDIDELQLELEGRGTSLKSIKRELRNYQEEAIERWEDNGFKGILEMATGTGKTLAALRAVLSYVPSNALVVVAVPTEVLASQWKNAIREEFRTAYIAICDSNHSDWPERLEVLKDYSETSGEGSNRCFAVTTYHTASTERFELLISKLVSQRLMLIADEVHHAGAPVFSRTLTHDFGYRLGLSATPERYWDELGSLKIQEFFGGVVFEYPISRALADGVLCNYEYHIVPVILENDELEEYSELTTSLSAKVSQIVKAFPQLRGLPFPRLLGELSRLNPSTLDSLQVLMVRRTNILKKARGKADALKEIVEKARLGRCLIYCNDQEHLQETLNILYNLNISGLRYDSSMSDEERTRNLLAFSTGGDGFMTAIRCLDEGVDIPECDSAILISNSKSTREYIQRRGRLLRLSPGKDLARIYDMIILPVDPETSSKGISSAEFKMLENEIDRARIFASSAVNGTEILLQLKTLEAGLSSRIID